MNAIDRLDEFLPPKDSLERLLLPQKTKTTHLVEKALALEMVRRPREGVEPARRRGEDGRTDRLEREQPLVELVHHPRASLLARLEAQLLTLAIFFCGLVLGCIKTDVCK